MYGVSKSDLWGVVNVGGMKASLKSTPSRRVTVKMRYRSPIPWY